MHSLVSSMLIHGALYLVLIICKFKQFANNYPIINMLF